MSTLPKPDSEPQAKLLPLIEGSNAIDHKAAKKAVFGSSNEAFLHGFITQLANVGSQGKTLDERGLAFVVSIVEGIEPQDQVEAMLASQMAAVHLATMTFARRLAHCETIPQQDSAERAFNKLARTFAVQIEALRRYRSKGTQHVIVERVNVEPGGQAIVGNVAHGGGSGRKD